ncbi:14-3-3 protein [Histomonas meleagridis]|uniref:14-3-3 protein n=1 Tax=Histomonas meleagridis TaxID=135588 RepID=UPI00355ABB7B|nr:14-3-3 protein [Histomonas meleagridis]KAH0805657.1 14-3-3 protein [Histomonas meleagridis]
MSSERELLFYMARVADQAERYKDVLKYINKIIDIDPNLNADERNLLSVAYKALTGSCRSTLRTVNAFLDDEMVKTIPERVEKLTALKESLEKELDQYCDDVISLTDSKLIGAATNATAKVFYEKLKADYYRYSVEFKSEADRKEKAQKAKECYEKALDIAKEELKKSDPTFLGLALNYSVFLYEILGKKQEAIDYADTTFKEAVDILDILDEDEYSEATLILQLLKDNVSLWSDEQAEQ